MEYSTSMKAQNFKKNEQIKKKKKGKFQETDEANVCGACGVVDTRSAETIGYNITH